MVERGSSATGQGVVATAVALEALRAGSPSAAAATVAGMVASMSTVTVDCAHASNLARFWAAVLGWDIAPGATAEFAAVGGPQRPAEAPSLMLVQVPEPKTGKNRWHLDLSVEQDLEGEVERLISLGAGVLRRISEDGAAWVTLTDPEGNEFCVAAPHELTSEPPSDPT